MPGPFGCCGRVKLQEPKKHHHHHHHHHHKDRCEDRSPQAYMIYPIMPMSGCQMPEAPMQGQGACGNPVCGLNPMNWMQ